MSKIKLILALLVLSATTFAQTSKKVVKPVNRPGKYTVVKPVEQKATVELGASFLSPVLHLQSITFGTGVDATINYKVCSHASVTADFGYNNLFYEYGKGAGLEMIPIKGGFKVHLYKKLSFATNAGVVFYINNDSGNDLTYAGKFIYQANNKVNVSLGYTGVDVGKQIGFVAFRLGYTL